MSLFLFLAWMQGVQGIMCVSLVLEISVVIVYVIVMFHMLRQKYVYVTLLVTAGANFISGMPKSEHGYITLSIPESRNIKSLTL